MSAYEIAEVDPQSTFAQLELVIWHAHHHPYQAHFSAYHPVFGPNATDREAAMQRSIVREWAAHRSDPQSRWLSVLEKSSGNVVGGCQWKFYHSDPYNGPGPGAAYDPSMWPEGSVGREFVQLMMHKQYAHRKGIGSLLMEWGLHVAQKDHLEVFLHSTGIARHLYEKHGLRVVQKIEIDMEVSDPSDEWEKLRHELGPLRFFIMWKPADGTYEEGDTQLPWEVEAGTKV